MSEITNIRVILRDALKRGATDVLLVAGSPATARIHGRLVAMGEHPLTPDETRTQILSIMPKDKQLRFDKTLDEDFAYSLDDGSRFRVNAHFQQATVAATIRPIPRKIPTLEALHLPPSLLSLVAEPRGLVLVTGPTGSGKSTTLAILVDYINRTRGGHIVTVEDPVEYLHTNQKGMIEQREVGTDTVSFADALRHALRQNPDVILVGEMRDLETVATALTAAETGHLVLSTLHTNDSVQAIDRIVDVFPPAQQNQIRVQLSLTLRGIVAQRLVPRADGEGMVPAIEVLVATSAVRNVIRKGNTHEMTSLLEIGSRHGMATMDASLLHLIHDKLITEESALFHAGDPEGLRRMLKGGGFTMA